MNEINGLLPDITEVYKTNFGRARGYHSITSKLDQNATGTLVQGKFDWTFRDKSVFRFNELINERKNYDPRGGKKVLSTKAFAHSKTSVQSLIDKIKAFCNCGPK